MIRTNKKMSWQVFQACQGAGPIPPNRPQLVLNSNFSKFSNMSKHHHTIHRSKQNFMLYQTKLIVGVITEVCRYHKTTCIATKLQEKKVCIAQKVQKRTFLTKHIQISLNVCLELLRVISKVIHKTLKHNH